MTDFSHSIVLFSGDDGLPLEFNVRNTKEKSLLKAMIEHGGGLCTQSDNAVHLIDPETKVLNAYLGKTLVSSQYVFDCVKENYLLEVNKYVFTISEAPTSDISEDSEGINANKPEGLLNEMVSNLDGSINSDPSTIPEKLDCNNSNNTTTSGPSSMQQKSTTISNLSESFIEGSQDVSEHPRIAADIQPVECVPLTSTAKDRDSLDLPDDYNEIENDLSPIQGSASIVSPLKRTHDKIPKYGLLNSPKRIGIYTDSSIELETSQSEDSPIVKSPQKKSLQVISPIKGSASIMSPLKRTHDEIPKYGLLNSPKQIGIYTDSSIEMETSQSEDSPMVTSPQKKSCTFLRYEQKEDSEEELQIIPYDQRFPVGASPVHAAVSSSQPGMDLDQFDNLLLNKAQQKPQIDDDDGLSQSYTVSSSADIQKPSSSAEVNSAEMFGAGPSSQIPDSPSQGDDHIAPQDQTSDIQSYMQRLEVEVKQILEKPSPKSIQDKICLVKYVCCVKKLSPACVLQSLHQL